MMMNNTMVQELNESQLDMVVGGSFFTRFVKTVKRRVVNAWNTVKPYAEKAVDIVEATIEYRNTR